MSNKQGMFLYSSAKWVPAMKGSMFAQQETSMEKPFVLCSSNQKVIFILHFSSCLCFDNEQALQFAFMLICLFIYA